MVILFLFIFVNLGKLDISESPIKSDAVLCLGGGRGERLHKTIELYKKGYINNLILISDTKQNYIRTKVVKLKKEIDKNIIIKKRITKTTLEELLYAESIMEKFKFNSILIVSDEPHTRRIKMLIENFTNFEKLKIRFRIVGSNVTWWDKNNIYKTKKSLWFITDEFFKIIHNYFFYTLIKHSIISQNQLDKINNFKASFSREIHLFIEKL